MTSSSEPVASCYSEELDLPPSCVEFCPAHPAYFLVGTYNLERPDERERSPDLSLGDPRETTDNTIKKPQNRNGTIIVFKLVEDRPIRTQTMSQPSAILDLHFQQVDGRLDIGAVVSSTGTLSVFRLDPSASPNSPLELLSVFRIPGIDEDVLFLSCAWHPVIEDLIALTTSTGHVHVLKLTRDYTGIDALQDPFITHSLEAWCLAFSPSLHPASLDLNLRCSQALTLYSGADDSTLRYTSCGVRNEKGTDPWLLEVLYPPVKVDGHGAGVTAILPLSLTVADGAELVVTGSYDDVLRVYAIQPLHRTFGMRRARLLDELNLGGGVWRLKLIDVVNLGADEGSSWTVRILASCMHAGARIVEIRGGSNGYCQTSLLARFEEHRSMNYGSDFQPGADCVGKELLFVSTSFYDKLLCVWHYGDGGKR